MPENKREEFDETVEIALKHQRNGEYKYVLGAEISEEAEAKELLYALIRFPHRVTYHDIYTCDNGTVLHVNPGRGRFRGHAARPHAASQRLRLARRRPMRRRLHARQHSEEVVSMCFNS
jgi:hypothetical protein